MSNPFNMEARLRILEKKVEQLMSQRRDLGSVEFYLPERSDSNRGPAGRQPRLIFNSTDGMLNIDDGTNWTLPDGTIT